MSDTLFTCEGVDLHVVAQPEPVVMQTGAVLTVVPDDDECTSLTVGDHTIKLHKDLPSLRSSDLRFVFPSFGESKFYGVTFPHGTSDQAISDLTAILLDRTRQLIDQRPPSKDKTPAPSTSSSVNDVQPGEIAEGGDDTVQTPKGAVMMAKGIEKTSETVAWGLVKGAALMGAGIKKGATKLKTVTTPRKEPVVVSDKTKQAIEKSKSVAADANATTAGVLKKVEETTQEIADQAALAAQKTEKGKQISNSPYFQGGVEVAKAGLVAMGNVYEGMIDAGVNLATDTAEATADYVGHKHGEEAGAAVAESTVVLKDLGQTLHNASKLRPKGFVKRGAIKYVKNRVEGVDGEEEELSAQQLSLEDSQAAEVGAEDDEEVKRDAAAVAQPETRRVENIESS